MAATGRCEALGDFSLSSVTRQALQARGVKVLFPIQAATFSTIFDEKRDLLARARTGTGKTLAFALPIIESLIAEKSTREPRALVLAPTRELAQQVLGDFAEISRNRLKTLCVYGGSATGPRATPLTRCGCGGRHAGADHGPDRKQVLQLYLIEICSTR